jgi:dTDP-4-amino-4,6-dideoxygalactose transaminase
VGATPIPVEPRISTYNINPQLIEAAITSKTKAIMPVHLYGQCCEMDAIMHLANKYDLYVVEDNAQSQGAMYNGKLAGSFGHINGTSFYPGKNLGAYGDAGAITTNNKELFNKACTIRNYGSSKKYYNEIKGINSRLDELQAGFLSIKLNHLPNWNTQRIHIAQLYHQLLSGVGDLILPELATGATSVFHLFVVRTQRRDALQQFLTEKGIGTLIHYPLPPHLQEAYKDLNYTTGDFPIAEEIANTCLSLPVGNSLVGYYQEIPEEKLHAHLQRRAEAYVVLEKLVNRGATTWYRYFFEHCFYGNYRENNLFKLKWIRL